jgi:hypothetical protein
VPPRTCEWDRPRLQVEWRPQRPLSLADSGSDTVSGRGWQSQCPRLTGRIRASTLNWRSAPSAMIRQQPEVTVQNSRPPDYLGLGVRRLDSLLLNCAFSDRVALRNLTRAQSCSGDSESHAHAGAGVRVPVCWWPHWQSLPSSELPPAQEPIGRQGFDPRRSIVCGGLSVGARPRPTPQCPLLLEQSTSTRAACLAVASDWSACNVMQDTAQAAVGVLQQRSWETLGARGSTGSTHKCPDSCDAKSHVVVTTAVPALPQDTSERSAHNLHA